MKVIGVIGQNGSGKDEVLKYLRAKYNMPFYRPETWSGTSR
jgi:dephospho-CoA kinase